MKQYLGYWILRLLENKSIKLTRAGDDYVLITNQPGFAKFVTYICGLLKLKAVNPGELFKCIESEFKLEFIKQEN